jgi:hypothetical protein
LPQRMAAWVRRATEMGACEHVSADEGSGDMHRAQPTFACVGRDRRVRFVVEAARCELSLLCVGPATQAPCIEAALRGPRSVPHPSTRARLRSIEMPPNVTRAKVRLTARGVGSKFEAESSDQLGPVVIRRDRRARPLLAIHIHALAGQKAIVRVLEDGNPRRGLGVLKPLDVVLALRY